MIDPIEIDRVLLGCGAGVVLGCLASFAHDWWKYCRKPDSTAKPDHNFTEDEE